MSTKSLSALDAVQAVLAQAKEPLHSKEITRRILDQALWNTTGKTPSHTLNARIAVDIKKKGKQSRFQRTSKGIYALREWGMPEYKAKYTVATKQEKSATSLEQTFSFTDSAEKVLAKHADQQPTHYHAIMDKMVELGLVEGSGKVPDGTLNALLQQEIKLARQQGEVPRFFDQGNGHYGLTAWADGSISQRITQHNRKVREQLQNQLQEMSWEGFGHVIGRFLIALGFQNITISDTNGEDEIDLRGTLVVGEVIRTPITIQVKRWERGKNIRKSTVKRLRGSLDKHAQGLIITTSDLSDGAEKEAARPNTHPVALMSGDALVRAMIAHDIGIERRPYDLIDLAHHAED